MMLLGILAEERELAPVGCRAAIGQVEAEQGMSQKVLK
jgi:hypothetical protein